MKPLAIFFLFFSAAGFPASAAIADDAIKPPAPIVGRVRLDFDKVSLEEALEVIARASDRKIEWAGKIDIAVRFGPITVHTQGKTSVTSALKQVLSPLDLTFRPDADVVVILDNETARDETRTYDMSDWKEPILMMKGFLNAIITTHQEFLDSPHPP
jgi:hypothetical protein